MPIFMKKIYKKILITVICFMLNAAGLNCYPPVGLAQENYLRPISSACSSDTSATMRTESYQEISDALRAKWLAAYPDDKGKRMLMVKALRLQDGNFNFKADADYHVNNKIAVEDNEAASICLYLEGDLIRVRQFTVNPHFYNTDAAFKLLNFALENVSHNTGARRVQFYYMDVGSADFLVRVAEDTGFMVGPINFEEEFWALGKKFTGEDILLKPQDSRDASGRNPLMMASRTLLDSLDDIHNHSEENIDFERALNEVEKAMHMVIEGVGINSNHALYFPDTDELARQIIQVVDEQEHIGWKVQYIAQRPWQSRHKQACPFSGGKWFFERAVQGNLSAEVRNKLCSADSWLDLQRGTWHVSDRRRAAERLGYNASEQKVLAADIANFGNDANTITYQAIYAPTLKRGDSPVLLGVIWVTGHISPFQLRALQSYAFQAGYALEKIYLMYSLKARQEQLEHANSRLRKLNRIVQRLSEIGVNFHDLKNSFFVVAGFTGYLTDEEHIAVSDGIETRNTTEGNILALMDIVKQAHADINELEEDIIFHSTPLSALLASCNANLAACLLQIRGYKDHPKAVERKLRESGRGLPDDIHYLDITVDSLKALHDLYSVVHRLQTAYIKIEETYAGVLKALSEIFPLLGQYLSSPIEELELLAAGGSEIEGIAGEIRDSDYVRYNSINVSPDIGIGPYSMHPLAHNPLILYLATINNRSVNDLISALVESGFPINEEYILKEQAVHFPSLLRAAEGAGIKFEGVQFRLESGEQRFWCMLSADAVKQASKVIYRITKRIPELVERLMELAEGSAEEEPMRVISLHEIVTEATEEVRGEFEIAGIQLDHNEDNDKGPVMISTRPNTLKNFVILELLGNTIKYMPDEKAEKRVSISYSLERRGYARLIIQDTGNGMSKDFIRNSLFSEPGAMEELEGSQEQTLKGRRSGMGLYFAREIMRSFGGDLYVSEEHTAAGHGSCLVLEYPLTDTLAEDSTMLDQQAGVERAVAVDTITALMASAA